MWSTQHSADPSMGTVSCADALQEAFMAESVRVLLVDDCEPWRQHVRSILLTRPELRVVAEVADGLEAVQKAQELQPDLILLDIGLPQPKRNRSCEAYSPSRFRRKNPLLK